MAEIKICCTNCNHEMKINIKTIDELRKKPAQMTKNRDHYKAKLAALEQLEIGKILHIKNEQLEIEKIRHIKNFLKHLDWDRTYG